MTAHNDGPISIHPVRNKSEKREFVELAFAQIGRQIVWSGRGVSELGQDAATGETLVRVDARYFRPTEVDILLGDPSKAREKLGWSPRVTFPELVAEMMREDLRIAQRDALIKKAGFKAFDHHE